jgi:hypothetical protein
MDNGYFDDEGPSEIAETDANHEPKIFF